MFHWKEKGFFSILKVKIPSLGFYPEAVCEHFPASVRREATFCRACVPDRRRSRHNLRPPCDVEDMRPGRLLWVAAAASAGRACPLAAALTHKSCLPQPHPHTNCTTTPAHFFHHLFFYSCAFCSLLRAAPHLWRFPVLHSLVLTVAPLPSAFAGGGLRSFFTASCIRDPLNLSVWGHHKQMILSTLFIQLLHCKCWIIPLFPSWNLHWSKCLRLKQLHIFCYVLFRLSQNEKEIREFRVS